MYYSKGYEAYKNNNILHSSKEKLLLMILDEAVKNGKLARKYMESKKYDEANKSIQKVQDIFLELMTSLDKSLVKSEWVNNMLAIYTFIYEELIRINMAKNINSLDKLLPLISDVRDLWYEANENKQ